MDRIVSIANGRRGMCTECVEWGGRRWHRYAGSRYHEYRGTRSLGRKDRDRLHRAIWKASKGPIPDGLDVHHIDENPSNNALENLDLLSRSDHMRHHVAGRTDFKAKYEPRATACSKCGVELVRRTRRKPICIRCQHAAGDKRRTIDRQCKVCNSTFQTITGNYCSQRCVNLGGRWPR